MEGGRYRRKRPATSQRHLFLAHQGESGILPVSRLALTVPGGCKRAGALGTQATARSVQPKSRQGHPNSQMRPAPRKGLRLRGWGFHPTNATAPRSGFAGNMKISYAPAATRAHRTDAPSQSWEGGGFF